MEPTPLSAVARAIGAPAAGDAEVQARGVSFDTRTLRPGDLFFALEGGRVDGHAFVANALSRGAAGAVVRRGRGPSGGAGRILEVEDPLAALSALAAHVRAHLSARVVAVTGSNGKTTVKGWIADALAEVGPVHASPASYNNSLGMPATLAATPPEARFVVLEMGANHPGELAALAAVARPDAAVLTSLGAAHLEGFGSPDGVARAKGELLRAVGPRGKVWVPDNVSGIALEGVEAPVERVGESPAAQWRIEDVRSDGLGYRFLLRGVEYVLPVPGRHNVRNAALSLSVAISMGAPPGALVPRVARWTLPPGRLGLVRGTGGCLLDDSYNANPDSLRAGLAVLALLPAPRVAILGEMGELGEESARAHEEAGEQVASIEGAILIAVGPRTGDAARAARKAGVPVRAYPDAAAALAAIDAWWTPGASGYVKGSRAAGLEGIARAVRARCEGDQVPPLRGRTPS